MDHRDDFNSYLRVRAGPSSFIVIVNLPLDIQQGFIQLLFVFSYELSRCKPKQYQENIRGSECTSTPTILIETFFDGALGRFPVVMFE